MECSLNHPSHIYTQMLHGNVKAQDSIKNANLILQQGSIIVIVTGAAFAAIGLLKASVFPLLIGLTSLYLSFNLYQACQNNKDVIENPKKYVTLTGTAINIFSSNKNNPISFSYEKVRNQLVKNTIMFEWAIDYFLTKSHTI